MKILDRKITWERLLKDRLYKINKSSDKKIKISKRLEFNAAISDNNITSVVKRNENEYRLMWKERTESISRSKSAFISRLIRIS